MTKSAKRKRKDVMAAERREAGRMVEDAATAEPGTRAPGPTTFEKPWPVSDIQIAFCGNSISRLPPLDSIPDEFKNDNNGNKWIKFFRDWFYSGSKIKDLQFDMKPGIDGEAAIRHLKSVIGGFDSKHEHKIAGFAYICSLWFNDISYDLE